MSVLTVTKTRLVNGRYEGVISDVPEGIRPGVAARVRDRAVEDLSVTPMGDGTWRLIFDVPASAISDGIQTIAVVEANTGEVLDSLAIIAGEPANETMQAEIDLLREELDLLKRAFRRHCVETA
ncbi:hypothetical protein OB2597_10891 [Pseudooceanicola batsensis HTCC2597]|uniref:Uncharacterized protein n=1 Tax=Pseudooceanicola batsensis (strain ATCC BAA-863 / DSM 15984 / KCTC 12145 / HTCC2597) TaxID=252305 RepID=A3TVU8_PSEBH|nr:hypothetical protein [Pseudooceanicola batsensis]EAQ03744.1 hypothetical protein OB2597_10891 [Pseudooceanicola batsensis HTCC2597]